MIFKVSLLPIPIILNSQTVYLVWGRLNQIWFNLEKYIRRKWIIVPNPSGSVTFHLRGKRYRARRAEERFNNNLKPNMFVSLTSEINISSRNMQVIATQWQIQILSSGKGGRWFLARAYTCPLFFLLRFFPQNKGGPASPRPLPYICHCCCGSRKS